MSKHIRGIVSMLTSADQTTLITDTGDMIVLKNDSVYDIVAIGNFLASHLTGISVVQLDLENFVKPVVEGLDLGDGIAITQVIEGKEVQGIFYPVAKTAVTVEVEGEKVEVPNVENLRAHIDRANEESSPSVRNFLKLLAPVLKDRLHSGEDLMAFIEKSELPLTNDGRIIAYKKVKTLRGEEGVYVDCHSGKVKQRIGSRVQMDISMVDPSRNKSCSHGLHVCNLGYLRNFPGDTILITLVDPTNFIAVPHGETTKARVRSYDIIGAISSSELGGDNVVLQALVSVAVDGGAVVPDNLVTIHQDGEIVYGSLGDGKAIVTSYNYGVKPSSGESLKSTAPVTAGPSNVVKAVKSIKQAAALTLADQAVALYGKRQYTKLKAFKKAKKKSWAALGINGEMQRRIEHTA